MAITYNYPYNSPINFYEAISMSIKDIHFEYATINYAGAMKGWALPGRTFTKSRNVAEKAAMAINKLINNDPNFDGFKKSFKVKH